MHTKAKDSNTHIHRPANYTKLKSGLGTVYAIWPGNESGPHNYDAALPYYLHYK